MHCTTPSYIHDDAVGSTHLENNVTDVEDGQDLVVVVTLQAQVLLKTSQTSIADVRSIDEAEKVQQCNGGDDIEVDLPPELGLGLGIECEECIAVAERVSSCSMPVKLS